MRSENLRRSRDRSVPDTDLEKRGGGGGSVSSRSLGCLDAPASTAQLEAEATRELKQRRRRRQRERQRSSRFRLVKQQLCTCITLFDTFLCRRCTSTTWKCLNSGFVEDGNTRQRHSSSFPELRCSPLEFNSKQIRHHFVNWTRWKELDYVWNSADSLFLSHVFVAVAVLVAWAHYLQLSSEMKTNAL